jgi:large subunit ribosomal protein L10
LPARKVQPWKKEALERMKGVMKMHDVVAAADLRGVRSTQIQEIRKTLRDKATMLVTKNTIFRKASQELEPERKNINKFAESIRGPLVLLFTDMNPFQLILFLNKNKVKVPAKGGDIATSSITIPAGNTGLPPGPIISEFGEVKIPTKIESGSIWVAKDTLVARKGDTIPTKLASVLTRLGMKPMEAGLSIVAAYDKGSILNRDALALDLEDFKKNIAITYMQALILASEAGYLKPETALMIIGKAWRQAHSLAVKSEYVTPDTVNEILRTAYTEMTTLTNRVSAISKETAPNLGAS